MAMCGVDVYAEAYIVWRSQTRSAKREGLVTSLYNVLYSLQKFCSPIRLQNG